MANVDLKNTNICIQIQICGTLGFDGWRSRVVWPHCPFSLGSKTFWANLNPIRKPGRHLPDIISYHPNEDWWLAKGTNWCCPWEKGLNGSPGLLLATNSLSDRADAISCPPQSWNTGHGDALNGEKLVQKCIKAWHKQNNHNDISEWWAQHFKCEKKLIYTSKKSWIVRRKHTERS